jgi:hypothetical protein
MCFKFIILDIAPIYKKKFDTNSARIAGHSQPLRTVNTLNSELNPISHLLALLGAHPILHVGRIRVNDQYTIP